MNEEKTRRGEEIGKEKYISRSGDINLLSVGSYRSVRDRLSKRHRFERAMEPMPIYLV